ncbi:PP2C family serine/threonine-protein phosphatase [Thiospirillum jenense]|uniref:Protein phosphatase 2C domain-containing protein n=1 Tax=Thiospirillum jenense TaxID=1653858 RepID=A0A839HCM4_9GAMM|nr:PP2C family serine/threonine-protein phosphatase [Thiospirillum jenense]MBB1126715.1 protein phosphatase 2C domain-containing protein [Thiospirillum jenense]
MYKTVCAAVQGISHSGANIPCQDRVLSMSKNGITVLSLADGAGSAKHSDTGAEIIVNQINRLIIENFHEFYEMNEDNLKVKISSAIFYSLFWESFERNIPIKHLSSTLLFVAVNESNYLVGHIGDGMIGYMHNENMEVIVDVFSYPAKGEYYNSTFFTTDDNIQQQLRIYRGSMEKIEGFIIMSDGGDEVLFDKKEKKFSPAVRKIFDWLLDYSGEEVQATLLKNMEEKFRLKTSDDCSVGVLRKN